MTFVISFEFCCKNQEVDYSVVSLREEIVGRSSKCDCSMALTWRLHRYEVGHGGRQSRQIRRFKAVAACAFKITRKIVHPQTELSLERRRLIQLRETAEGTLPFEHRRSGVWSLDGEGVVDLLHRRYICKNRNL